MAVAIYEPVNKVRFVTATTLFDGHDASINEFRRMLQASGAEVIHLGHSRTGTDIVDTAVDLETDIKGDVVKFAAGGFRDFTRIAASDPTMWRDVFLTNKDAVLEMLGRFNEDLSNMQRAIRKGDGPTLFDRFTRTRAIRRSIIQAKQA